MPAPKDISNAKSVPNTVYFKVRANAIDVNVNTAVIFRYLSLARLIAHIYTNEKAKII